LSGLNYICQVLSQFCRASMSSWSLVAPASVLMGLYRRQSANNTTTRPLLAHPTTQTPTSQTHDVPHYLPSHRNIIYYLSHSIPIRYQRTQHRIPTTFKFLLIVMHYQTCILFSGNI
jgi:hypothetical protein